MQIQTQSTARVRRYLRFNPGCSLLTHSRFVLKNKEQRATEKAMMDKSPLKTLTLEDFLETERQKLTGTLTSVTPETFAKWKKERLNKKLAEEEARKAKEATGRDMFERGDWQGSEDESEEDDDDDEADSGVGHAEWDLERLRLQTEEERARKEAERLAGGSGDAASVHASELTLVKGDG